MYTIDMLITKNIHCVIDKSEYEGNKHYANKCDNG